MEATVLLVVHYVSDLGPEREPREWKEKWKLQTFCRVSAV